MNPCGFPREFKHSLISFSLNQSVNKTDKCMNLYTQYGRLQQVKRFRLKWTTGPGMLTLCCFPERRFFSDIVDIKPANMEDLTEVITAAEFHPHHCNLFVYSSSKGTLRLCDMREAALCDKHSKCE